MRTFNCRSTFLYGQRGGLGGPQCAMTAGLVGRHPGKRDACSCLRSATPAAAPGSEGGEEFCLLASYGPFLAEDDKCFDICST